LSAGATQTGRPTAALLVGLAALSGLVTVILGALSAHLLAGRLAAAQLDLVRTALAYQGFHALALGLAGLLEHQAPSRWARAAGGLFVAGTLLFCGGIYAKEAGGLGLLGPLIPVGGSAFMAGWVCLLLASRRLESIS
jgi:uncharacterized membrane protein YgdD (TMEM256/DUF423 family)